MLSRQSLVSLCLTVGAHGGDINRGNEPRKDNPIYQLNLLSLWGGLGKVNMLGKVYI